MRIVLVFFVLAIAGCTRLPAPPEEMPELTPCTVVATFGGQTLEEVGVLLQPKNKEERTLAAGGKTDADGKAVLKTGVHYSGVVPGTYWITFRKFAPEESGPDGMPLPAKPLIPLKYSKGKPPLELTVTKERKEYAFELESL